MRICVGFSKFRWLRKGVSWVSKREIEEAVTKLLKGRRLAEQDDDEDEEDENKKKKEDEQSESRVYRRGYLSRRRR